ncbi:MAG: pseudoazurin [Thalassobaculaceae bacterium]|nr:pseudoazurin [Thalassobaculaceae bacterium]
MFSKMMMTAAALAMMAGSALAETYEVKMLNKGEAGSMVFQPDYVAAQPGDTIHFVATDKGHNVESIKGMLPAGVEDFKSKMNKDFDLVVETEGLYGLKCTPHYGMGMIALIQVGEATNLEDALAVKQNGKAKKRFEAAFGQVK